MAPSDTVVNEVNPVSEPVATITVTSDQWDSESELVSDVELSNSLRASVSTPPPLHLGSINEMSRRASSSSEEDMVQDNQVSPYEKTPHKQSTPDEPSFSQAITSTPRHNKLDLGAAVNDLMVDEDDDEFDSEDEMNSEDEVKVSCH